MSAKTTDATSREKGAVYDEETRFQRLQKEFDTFRLKCDPDTVKNVANRLDLSLEDRSPAKILGKIDTLNAEVSSLPALQSASDKLAAVVLKLGPGVKFDSDIAQMVDQLVTSNGALKIRHKRIS